MENGRILIDTSIVIEHFRNQNRTHSHLVKLFETNELCISVISIFELYNGATNEAKKDDIEILCNEIEVIDLNIETAKMASNIYLDLRKKNKLIEFRDILIGATAIQAGIKIATLNKKHFERIAQLQLYDIKY